MVRTPAIKCEFEAETWGPHSGCAEFMSRPEVHTCAAPATHVVKWIEVFYSDDIRKSRYCTWHAKWARDARIYRFRTV
jgi:hypothetical protein